MNNASLRRAAILITSLDTESADALLDEMASDQAESVRNAVMELGEIDTAEQQEVIEQFVGKSLHAATPEDPGVEIDPGLASKFGKATDTGQVDTDMADMETPKQPQPEAPPFAFLKTVDPTDLAGVLSAEHPQTTAIVVTHLAPAHAATVLEFMPREQRTETLMRIARLNTPNQDIVRDLEQEMRSLLVDRRRREELETTGLAAVEAILNSSSATARHDLVADLAQQDQTLVHQLGMTGPRSPSTTIGHANPATTRPSDIEHSIGQHQNTNVDRPQDRSVGLVASSEPLLAFTDLELLDSSELAQILHRCNSNTALLALAGASHQFVQKILAQLPGREASQLNRKIQQTGPLRLDDIERAQQQLVNVAHRLISEGSIETPRKQRLSVAA